LCRRDRLAVRGLDFRRRAVGRPATRRIARNFADRLVGGLRFRLVLSGHRRGGCADQDIYDLRRLWWRYFIASVDHHHEHHEQESVRGR